MLPVGRDWANDGSQCSADRHDVFGADVEWMQITVGVFSEEFVANNLTIGIFHFLPVILLSSGSELLVCHLSA